MLHEERHEQILAQLKIKHAVKVNTLAKELGASESTIRRDINELDRKGLLKRVFGGAVSLSGNIASEVTDIAERTRLNVEEKERIAQYAATLISDNDFVFIDAGTTTEKMIDYIGNKNVTYVTNGTRHAMKLAQRGFSAFMIGGSIRPTTQAAVGSVAIESIKQYNFTKCFMGANGVDIERGFTTPHISEAAIKAEAIRRSHVSYVLVDHEKFGRVSSVTFAGIEDASIITNRTDNPQYRQYTSIKEVDL
jgi:DeoR family fructose operon transcriptional repressor